MKFIINTKTLKDGLSVTSHAAAGITTSPVLENILIKVQFDKIILIANNLEMAIEYFITEDIDIISQGEFSVPSKLFSSYISLLDDQKVEIELIGDHSLQISTDSGVTKIRGIEAGEFPLIPQIHNNTEFHMPSSTFKAAIEKTLFSSAQGNFRPNLAGIFMTTKGEYAVFASTDVYRLGEYEVKLENANLPEFAEIIPSKTCMEIKNILKTDEDIKISAGENQIAFEFQNTKIYSRLLNGKFPEYSAQFATTPNTEAVVERNDLISALRKINLISRENNYSIQIHFEPNSQIILSTNETEVGEGKIELTGSVTGDKNTIGINSTFFLEVLGVMDSTHVSIKIEKPLSAIVITPIDDENSKNKQKGKFRHLLMPLKI